MAHSRAKTTYRNPGGDKLERKLKLLGIIPQGHVSHPELREYMMGLPAGWTDITGLDGGRSKSSPIRLAFLKEVSSTVATELPPSEMRVRHNRQQWYGKESDILFDSFNSNVLNSPQQPEVQMIDESSSAFKSHPETTSIGEQEASLVTVEVLEELTQDEEQERHRLELKVERAFYEAGAALRELKDKRLYRSTHRTFEEYSKDKFGFQRAHSYRLIEAATVVENLFPTTSPNNLSPIGRQILPTSERQVRDLINRESGQQRQIWQSAVKQSGGKVPRDRIVKDIVERLKSKLLVKASDFYQIGDVFTLTRLEGAEHKYNGYWAIASDINDFTLRVDVHGATILVKPENLKLIDEPDVRRQLPQTLKRIRRLRDVSLLDRGAYNVLEGLGRQTYLTPVEEGLLQWLENHYGVVSKEN